MDGKNGLILWILGGTGVLFLYSAYKAKSPQEVLLAHLAGKTSAQRESSAPEPMTGSRPEDRRISTAPIPFEGQRELSPVVKGGWQIV